MTKFTHPDDVPEGQKHEWITRDGKESAIPLKNGWWSVEGTSGGWYASLYSCPELIFKDKPVVHESEAWMNCYDNNRYHRYKSKVEADMMATGERLACVRVPFTWTEGQFDE